MKFVTFIKGAGETEYKSAGAVTAKNATKAAQKTANGVKPTQKAFGVKHFENAQGVKVAVVRCGRPTG